MPEGSRINGRGEQLTQEVIEKFLRDPVCGYWDGVELYSAQHEYRSGIADRWHRCMWYVEGSYYTSDEVQADQVSPDYRRGWEFADKYIKDNAPERQIADLAKWRRWARRKRLI
jgi:hypothetical protein